jgi:hypothetical protein
VDVHAAIKKPEIPFGVVTQTSYQTASKRRKFIEPVDFTSDITSVATAARKNNHRSAFSETEEPTPLPDYRILDGNNQETRNIGVSAASEGENINGYTMGTCNSSKIRAGKFSTNLKSCRNLVNRPQLQTRSVT